MTTIPDAAPAVSVYGLARPTLADVHAAIRRVYPDNGERVWAALLAAAQLTGQETTLQALHHLLDTAITTGDPVLGLVASAQTIRVRSFEHFSTVYDTLASVR